MAGMSLDRLGGILIELFGRFRACVFGSGIHPGIHLFIALRPRSCGD